MIREISLENVVHANDGRIAVVFNRQVRRLISDCEDRPGEEKARELSLTLRIKPIVLQDGACTDVEIEHVIHSSIPRFIASPISCRVKQGGRALFNDMSEDNVDQKTIDEI